MAATRAWRVGAGRDLITPPFPVLQGGYGSRSENYESVHDDCWVRAIALDDGINRAAIWAFDLTDGLRGLRERLAAWAKEKYNIEPGLVLTSATHSHAAPDVGWLLENSDREDLKEPQRRFLAMLEERAKMALDRAFVNLAPATAKHTRVPCDWGMNRRLKVNGEVQLAANPDNPREREMDVIRFDGPDGRCRVLAAFYSCHPVGLGGVMQLSAEFPGRFCQILEADTYGGHTLFFQGACGNLRPRLTVDGNGKWRQMTFDDVDAMAQAMAQAVRCGAAGPWTDIQPDLAGDIFPTSLPVTPFPKATLEKELVDTRRQMDEAKTPEDRNAWAMQEGFLAKLVANYEKSPQAQSVSCGVLRLGRTAGGPFYIAHMSGEPCLEVKQLVTAALAEKGGTALFCGYANSMTSYIPTDAILAEGGYEAASFFSHMYYGLPGPFTPGIDARFRDAYRAARDKLEK